MKYPPKPPYCRGRTRHGNRTAAHGRASRGAWRRFSGKAIRFPALTLLVLLASPWPVPSMGQGISREHEIKAAYLYNFARYVRWPASSFPSAKDPLVIGVLGVESGQYESGQYDFGQYDRLGSNLDRIAAAKKIDGRKIVVRRFASLDEYTASHVLFVPGSTSLKDQLRAIRRFHGTPLLLVGETPGFAPQGGMVNFVIEGNNVRFEINRKAAEAGQLRISAKLLRLGKPPRNRNSRAWEEAKR